LPNIAMMSNDVSSTKKISSKLKLNLTNRYASSINTVLTSDVYVILAIL